MGFIDDRIVEDRLIERRLPTLGSHTDYDSLKRGDQVRVLLPRNGKGEPVEGFVRKNDREGQYIEFAYPGATGTTRISYGTADVSKL